MLVPPPGLEDGEGKDKVQVYAKQYLARLSQRRGLTLCHNNPQNYNQYPLKFSCAHTQIIGKNVQMVSEEIGQLLEHGTGMPEVLTLSPGGIHMLEWCSGVCVCVCAGM